MIVIQSALILIAIIAVLAILASFKKPAEQWEEKHHNSVCPICLRPFDKTRRPVIFHTSYTPEKVIIGCQICNEIEYLHRTNNLPRRLEAIKRAMS